MMMSKIVPSLAPPHAEITTLNKVASDIPNTRGLSTVRDASNRLTLASERARPQSINHGRRTRKAFIIYDLNKITPPSHGRVINIYRSPTRKKTHFLDLHSIIESIFRI